MYFQDVAKQAGLGNGPKRQFLRVEYDNKNYIVLSNNMFFSLGVFPIKKSTLNAFNSFILEFFAINYELFTKDFIFFSCF